MFVIVPELPEVETIRGDLQCLVGKNIGKVEGNFQANIFKNASIVDLEKSLVKTRVLKIDRVGKYLIFYLEKNNVMLMDNLIIHLGMTGQLYLTSNLQLKHIHLIMFFEDMAPLVFRDPRRFGKIWWGPWDVLQKEGEVPKLGPDLLSKDFTLRYFCSMLNHRVTIKTVLLNQKLLAGLGNIYTDESLFEARISPLRKTNSLDDEEAKKLYEAIQKVIKKGIQNNGTTLVDFIGGTGLTGNNQNYLQVYQKAGSGCHGCGHLISRIVVGGRGTYFCKFCQV